MTDDELVALLLDKLSKRHKDIKARIANAQQNDNNAVGKSN